MLQAIRTLFLLAVLSALELTPEQRAEVSASREVLLRSVTELRKDLAAWNDSVPLALYATVTEAYEELRTHLNNLNHTVQRFREEMATFGAKANELYNLEDEQIRLMSNLTGKFAVLQSKIIHLDDEKVPDTVEAAFNKPSPRKNQIYESVSTTQANKSKEFATVLEGLMKKESNFAVIYVVLGMVRDTQVWLVLLSLWCMLSRVRDRQSLRE